MSNFLTLNFITNNFFKSLDNFIGIRRDIDNDDFFMTKDEEYFKTNTDQYFKVLK